MYFILFQSEFVKVVNLMLFKINNGLMFLFAFLQSVVDELLLAFRHLLIVFFKPLVEVWLGPTLNR